jgi:hypothetical protein
MAAGAVKQFSRLSPAEATKGDFLFCLYRNEQATFYCWGDKQHMAAQQNYAVWIYGLLSEPFSGPETYFFVSTSCKQTATLIS